MPYYKQPYKAKLGECLVQLRDRVLSPSDEQLEIIRVLQSLGIARFEGPPPRYGSMSGPEAHTLMTIMANSYYEPTGLGYDLLHRYSTEQLSSGKFLLPGESEWFDRWPWKLVLPAVLSIVVAIITTMLVNAITGGKK